MIKLEKILILLLNCIGKKLDEINNIENIIEPYLLDYLENVSNSIGVRQQSKIPRNLALYLAECRADHKDLSLYF